MQNKINQLFHSKGNNLLSIYFTAGYPKLNDTIPVLRELQSQGIDMVEVGIPFSDPMADGPVIQASGNTAIKNGMSLKVLFNQLKDMRSEITIPVLLMGYLNVVMQYGLEAFCRDCKAVGVDGIILPDLPMKDYLEEFKPVMDQYGLAMVLLITPDTSDERIRAIDDNTSSFIYMVSSASTTGAQSSFNDIKLDYFKRINEMGLKNPRLVGFGISNRTTLDAAWNNSSGAIIGSRFIECLTQTDDAKSAVNMLMEGLCAKKG
jgi:tryptophan synthase alpha chain